LAQVCAPAIARDKGGLLEIITRKTYMFNQNQAHLLSELSAQPGKTGGEPAMTTLYRRDSDPLRKDLCKHLTEDADLIEEVVQDTFLDVWKHPDRFRGEAVFKNWLISIARHKAIDALRKRKVEIEPLDDYTDVLVADDPIIIDQIQNEQVVQALAR
jgi:DNA-directed RNA polymerase specialized sigma24 family protein